ncbi:MAG: phospholipase D-like domain-containing protein [Gemmatimonadota bacterium]|nr:phospholipase D-like domain-containing protein [Gemmatimonadota bacterium]
MNPPARVSLVLLGVVLVLLALVGALTLTRGTPVRMVVALGDRDGPPPATDSLFTRTMELYTGVHIEPGNRVEELLNGNGTYPRLWRDLAEAKQTITVQMYYALPSTVADTLQKYLMGRARAKVRVLLLLDAFGAQHLSEEWRDSLRAAGVQLSILRKLRWFSLHSASDRSHVRAVVVDGRVGYTGGFGLADYWLGDGRHDGQWRETNVRFEGPAVAQLQAAFAAAWAEANGELLTGDLFFPPATFRSAPGPTQAGLLFTSPTSGSTPAERFLALSIAAARKTLYIANSYFVPDDDFRKLLIRAAKSGVDVRVLTAGPKTDVKTTWYAGRARYEELLRGGVRIYEYVPTMMHSKTMVVDGLWATIGSMNFDNRSLAFNNESNLVTLDSAFGAQMQRTFIEDLRYAKEIRLAEFRRRPWTGKMLELGASLLSRLL